MQENVLKHLKNLGFTEYEAKTYLALLQQSPLTGYAVARISGVPRSKIYEVLGNLVERGDVLVSYGEPVQYAPKPPKELFTSRRRTLEQQFTAAEKGLEEFLGKNKDSDRSHLSGIPAVERRSFFGYVK